MDIKADAESLRVLLQNPRKFNVPRYQRPISWKEEDYKELWEDLLTAFEASSSDEYFMGTIVLTENARGQDQHEVVDGQQRIAAFVTLLTCLYQYANGAKENPESWITKNDENTRNYLEAIRDEVKPLVIVSNLTREYRLTLTKKDQPNLQSKVYAGEFSFDDVSLRIKPTDPRIEKAKKSYLKQIKSLVDREKGSVDKLFQFVAFLLDRTKFVRIFVGGSSDAFALFESLNWKGEKLTNIDLLKNKILSKNNNYSHMDDLADRWESICEAVATNSSKGVIDFVRDHENAQSARILTASNLYKEISKLIDNSGFSVDGYLNKLSTASAAYITLTDNSNVWPSAKNSNGSLDETLAEISHLNYDACMPFLLRVKLDKPDFLVEAARMSLSLLFRGKTVGSMTGQDMVKIFNSLVRELATSGDVESVKLECQSIIQEKWDLRDNGFKENFERFEAKSKAAKYALTKIYAHKYGTHVTVNYGNVDLEHVFPQNPKEKWSKFDRKGLDNEDWIYRVGNTILLERSLNRGISNSNFDAKSECYKKSELKDGRDLVENYPEWTAENILDRSKSLANLAVEVWKLV